MPGGVARKTCRRMIVESEYEALKRQAIEDLSSGGFLELLRDEVKRLPKLATDRPWMPARNKPWVAFDGGVNRRLNSGVQLKDSNVQ